MYSIPVDRSVIRTWKTKNFCLGRPHCWGNLWLLPLPRLHTEADYLHRSFRSFKLRGQPAAWLRQSTRKRHISANVTAGKLFHRIHLLFHVCLLAVHLHASQCAAALILNSGVLKIYSFSERGEQVRRGSWQFTQLSLFFSFFFLGKDQHTEGELGWYTDEGMMDNL